MSCRVLLLSTESMNAVSHSPAGGLGRNLVWAPACRISLAAAAQPQLLIELGSVLNGAAGTVVMASGLYESQVFA
ncbi:MAG: hypothetical protein R3C56_42975 [Pirellulaceae bacterium]